MYLTALNLHDKRILIVGGGTVATRKISGLLNQGADILVISPKITSEIQEWCKEGQVEWQAEHYTYESLVSFQPHLVFSTTDSSELNTEIAQDAREIGAWVLNTSDSINSDFHSLATIEKHPITIGISTNGASPVLISIIKERVAHAIGDDIIQLATWLRDIRHSSKTSIPSQADRQQLFRQIVQSDILSLLSAGQHDEARAQFDAFTHEALS